MSKFIKYAAKAKGVYFNLLAFLNPQKLQKDGFNLFSTPFSKKLKPHHQEFFDTSQRSVMEVNGDTIQTYKWGNGTQKVLLLHGWGSHSFRWRSLVKALAEAGYTVYALDAPAHGNSGGSILNLVIYERVIATFLKQNTDITSLVGHSMGAFAATFHLSQQPQSSIQKAVIMASPSSVKEFFEDFTRFLGLNQKAIELITLYFEKEFGQEPAYFTSFNFAPKISTPALIIHDSNDTATKHTNSIKLSEIWANATLKITEGLGHELKGEAIEQDIISFLNQ